MRPGDFFVSRQQCTGDASGQPRMVIPGNGFGCACCARELECRPCNADSEILWIDRHGRVA